MNVVAENLGVITDEVENLRRQFHFPGMRVLQFAWDSGSMNAFLPHNHSCDSVVYTGTHDNDTTLGWWVDLYQNDEKKRSYLQQYFASDGWEFNWTAIRTLMASVANKTIFPMQDLLGLGSEARINTPGKSDGNWTWRYSDGVLQQNLSVRLRELTEVYDRLPFVYDEEESEIKENQTDDR